MCTCFGANVIRTCMCNDFLIIFAIFTFHFRKHMISILYFGREYNIVRGDVKIPTYKPHTNLKKPSVSSHTFAPTTICDLSHSVCRSPLTDLGHISSVTYVCHPLWFVCGHRKGILTSPLNISNNDCRQSNTTFLGHHDLKN